MLVNNHVVDIFFPKNCLFKLDFLCFNKMSNNFFSNFLKLMSTEILHFFPYLHYKCDNNFPQISLHVVY